MRGKSRQVTLYKIGTWKPTKAYILCANGIQTHKIRNPIVSLYYSTKNRITKTLIREKGFHRATHDNIT